ncbi:ubiquitin-like protease [Chloropicon primus]|nr:ubiquitin-like protease [Chloropicon primus]
MAVSTAKLLTSEQKEDLARDGGEMGFGFGRGRRRLSHFDALAKREGNASTSEQAKLPESERMRQQQRRGHQESRVRDLMRTEPLRLGAASMDAIDTGRFYGGPRGQDDAFRLRPGRYQKGLTLNLLKSRIEDASRTKKRRVEKPVVVQEPIEVVISDGEESEEEGGGVKDDVLTLTPTGPGTRRSTRLSAGSSHRHTVAGVLERGKLKCVWKSEYGNGRSITIRPKDMDSLEDGEFLIDTVIDYYINCLVDDKRGREKGKTSGVSREDIYVFGTFFYKKLISCKSDLGKLSNWTRDVDIFSKKYVFIPICAHYHWSLILICNTNCYDVENELVDLTTAILHIDSMYSGHATGNITKNLRVYLKHEWHRNLKNPESICHRFDQGTTALVGGTREFTPKTILGGKLQCPRQNNFCDCGVFVLKFLEMFMDDPPNSVDVKIVNHKFTVEHTGSSEKFNTRAWFKPEDAAKLRKSLRTQLCQLFFDQNPESPHSKRALELACEVDAQAAEDAEVEVQAVEANKAAEDAEVEVQAVEASKAAEDAEVEVVLSSPSTGTETGTRVGSSSRFLPPRNNCLPPPKNSCSFNL